MATLTGIRCVSGETRLIHRSEIVCHDVPWPGMIPRIAQSHPSSESRREVLITSPNNPSYKYIPPFSHYLTIFIDETWSAFSLKLPCLIMFANHHLWYHVRKSLSIIIYIYHCGVSTSFMGKITMIWFLLLQNHPDKSPKSPCQGHQPRPSRRAWGWCAQSPRRVPGGNPWDLHGI